MKETIVAWKLSFELLSANELQVCETLVKAWKINLAAKNFQFLMKK